MNKKAEDSKEKNRVILLYRNICVHGWKFANANVEVVGVPARQGHIHNLRYTGKDYNPTIQKNLPERFLQRCGILQVEEENIFDNLGMFY